MHHRPAFSLVEALVAVGIAVLLIALLLPPLGAARTYGRSVECVHRLSQASVATSMYASNARELPPAIPLWEGRSNNAGLRARLFCDGKWWIETGYFSQGHWFSAVIAAQDRRPEPALRCASFSPGDRLDPLYWGHEVGFALCDFAVYPSTYALSASFLAVPHLWSSKPPSNNREGVSIQRISLVAHPTRKAFLFERVLFHRSNRAELVTSDTTTPVAFVDGSAALRDVGDATPGVRNPLDPRSTFPLHNTRLGVLGIDF